MAAQNSSPHEHVLSVKHDAKPAIKSPAELFKNERQKRIVYIAAFIVFQIGIIALFSLTIMKIRTPRLTLESAVFETFNTTTGANPSFHLRMNAQLAIKNTNFGGFKYEDTTVNFLYNGANNGAVVGSTSIPNSQVGWRTTKMVNVLVDLSSNNLPTTLQLGTDLNKAFFLTFSSQAVMKGEVELLQFVFKKEKTINLDCYITASTSEKTVHQISC